ncbi:MAG: pyridoxal phosphate-dependent aminotransferase [Pseudomonadota bacterium]
MPIKIDPIVSALADTVPFVAPEETERAKGVVFKARLGANEGNFGPASAAVAAIQKAASDDIWKYCDPTAFELRQALSRRLNIDLDEVVCGPGIDGLLGLIVRIFSSPGDTILTSLGAYPTFNYHVHAYGRTLKTLPYKAFREDLEGLAQLTREQRVSIVYVSNPDNPMGTWWRADAVEAFLNAVSPNTLIILDEAYGETAPDGTLPPIDTGRPNLIRLRTFSKAYGLAGLRVGYAFGNRELVKLFHRVRDHFGVNVMAQKAALASLDATKWLAEAIEQIADGRDRIAKIARDNNLDPIASATNFVTIDCKADGDFAAGILQRLADHGVFVRKPMAPGLDRCVRISVGRKEELDHLEAVLPQVL